MKTSAILSTVAIALTMTLTSATADASMTKPRIHTAAADLPALVEMEEELVEVADWMLNVEAFETELELIAIEDWMLDLDGFATIEKVDGDDELIEEEFISIEEWMLNPEAF